MRYLISLLLLTGCSFIYPEPKEVDCGGDIESCYSKCKEACNGSSRFYIEHASFSYDKYRTLNLKVICDE